MSDTFPRPHVLIADDLVWHEDGQVSGVEAEIMLDRYPKAGDFDDLLKLAARGLPPAKRTRLTRKRPDIPGGRRVIEALKELKDDPDAADWREHQGLNFHDKTKRMSRSVIVTPISRPGLLSRIRGFFGGNGG